MNFFIKFQWLANWKILLFVAVFLPLTCALGFWQLDRADEKRSILASQEAQQKLATMGNHNWRQDTENHLRSVELNLVFDQERYLLLANRLRNGQVGYEVLGVAFLPDEGDIPVLVNRGWVQASLDRNILPEVVQPLGINQVSGYYYCSQPNSMISQATEYTGDWPAVVFDLNQEAVEQIFESAQRPLPCQVRIDRASPLALLAGWDILNQTVEKHIGYAVQWFSMAFALMILALFSNSNLAVFFRKKDSGTSHTG